MNYKFKEVTTISDNVLKTKHAKIHNLLIRSKIKHNKKPLKTGYAFVKENKLFKRN